MSEDDYLHGVDVGIDLYIDRAHKAEALAASRLVLLEEMVEALEAVCFYGDEEPYDYTAYHKAKNELAKELGDAAPTVER
jgi:NTP pyrophosphatase (non-canonical NTP hydrolase)